MPIIYALPKQHKIPVKFRYIAAGVKCTTKHLSKVLGSALKHILRTVKNFYNYTYFFKKGSPVWVVDNRNKVLQNIRSLNSRRKAKSVGSYDFTTLYTSIPHDKLLYALKSVCDDAFKCSKKPYLIASKSRAYWSDKMVKSKASICFTQDTLMEYMEYLINNIYVTFDNIVYHQVIGIPMGTDCAPVVANLFLFYYEHKYIANLDDLDLELQYSFTEFTSRYIDDLLVLNDNDIFPSIMADIYPIEMQLLPTHDSNTRVTFLDLDISVKNKMFQCSLYDKRNDFNFKVTSMPHFNSNAPNSCAIGTFVSQMTRYLEINTDFSKFVEDCVTLKRKLIQQRFPTKYLNFGIKKFVDKNSLVIINKFWTIPKFKDFN